MTKQKATWRILVALSVAALAEAGGAGQAQAYGVAFHMGQPACQTVRQESTMLPASDGTVQDGRVIKVVTPVYPPGAIRAHISGVVAIDARIGTDGRILAVNVVSGPLALRRVAEYAVKRWQYEPSMLNGKPVEREAKVNLHFTLHGD